jgi:hypothetical protein
MLRLGSVVEYGFGPNTGAISLIYSHLLEKYNVGLHENVLVNHIGNDLQELIIKQSKQQIGINIRYQLPNNFNDLEDNKKNIFFTEIIHEALVRLAKDKSQIDITKLAAIRQEVLDKKFSFDILYKTYLNKKHEALLAKVIIHPELSRFNFLISLEDSGVEKCRLLIYTGKTTDFYIADLFFYGKWKNTNEFILSGKRSEIAIHIISDECKIFFVNTSADNTKAPLFELFKSDADKEKTLKEYIASLNPAIAAIITQSPN